MITEYSLCPQEHRLSSKVQFMALDYTLCRNSQSIVYILRAQFSSTENSLCPRVQFMSAEHSLCPQSTVSVPREQFMSLEHS